MRRKQLDVLAGLPSLVIWFRYCRVGKTWLKRGQIVQEKDSMVSDGEFIMRECDESTYVYPNGTLGKTSDLLLLISYVSHVYLQVGSFRSWS